MPGFRSTHFFGLISGNFACRLWPGFGRRDPQDHVAVAFTRAAHRLEPVDHAVRRHNQKATLAIWPGLTSLPWGSVASIAEKASAVIEIVTMRLMKSAVITRSRRRRYNIPNGARGADEGERTWTIMRIVFGVGPIISGKRQGGPRGGAMSFGMRPVPKSQMRKRRKRLALFPEVMPA